ncbi:MAG TPA: CPBP family intramembrane glutamic endopeptidase [Anaerolineae bacterium]|nr:CPBP family intramembrane glutamic endopeptidase [Anaerolineae bacterium]
MNRLRRYLPEPIVAMGLGLAFAFFALTFRGPRARFWQRMTGTGLALGTFALAAEPGLRRTRFSLRDVLAGLGSAGILYGVFQIGDRLARLILPKGGAEIDAIYGLETLRPRQELAARLAFIIGPAEELFWRGLVQARLMRQFGPLPGYVLGTAAYGGAHLVTGNLTLIAAATIAGAFWGGLSALGAPMGALIVSHAVWDVFTFLIAPTAGKVIRDW